MKSPLGITTSMVLSVLIFTLPSGATARDGRPQITPPGELQTSSASNNCVTPPAGLVAWWRAEGNASDTVNGNNGTLINGAGFAAGEVGKAFDLDGASQYVLVQTNNSALDVGQQDGFTIEGWINPSSLPDQRGIVEYENALGSTSVTDLGVHFYIDTPAPAGAGTGCIYANIKGAPYSEDHWITTPGNLLSTSVWQHVALTYDKTSGMAYIYYNGSIQASANFGSFTPLTDTKYLLLGARTYGYSETSPGDVFPGGLDEISIYNRALSSNEIAAIFLAGSAGKCLGPTPPEIIAQPANQTVLEGGTATFSVVPGGTGPFGFQWTFNGNNIVGATNVSLSLTNVHPWQAGNYAVKVTSPYGATNSASVLLTVITQNILIYKYNGTETIVTAGEDLMFPYHGLLFFLPDDTNGAYVGWATIKGKRTYWVSPISQNLWITIPGSSGQSYTLLGDVGSWFDDNGRAHLFSNLIKGWNTTLTIGAHKTFVFPDHFTGENTDAHPDSQTGQMKLVEADSSFTFAAPDTQAANNNGQTLADLINEQIRTLKNQGYQPQ